MNTIIKLFYTTNTKTFMATVCLAGNTKNIPISRMDWTKRKGGSKQ